MRKHLTSFKEVTSEEWVDCLVQYPHIVHTERKKEGEYDCMVSYCVHTSDEGEFELVEVGVVDYTEEKKRYFINGGYTKR